MYPSHNELTQIAQLLAKELDYQDDIAAIRGVCYGYCGIAIELLLTGNVREFQEQQLWLKKLIEEQHILEPGCIDRIPQKDKSKLLELFKKILIHQRPAGLIHHQNQNHITYIQELAKTMHSVQSDALRKQGGLHKVTAFCGVYNLEGNDLQNYLSALKKSVAIRRDTNEDIPFDLVLRNGNHYLLLAYHPTEPTGPWFLCNVNPYHIENTSSDKPMDINLIHNIPFEDIEQLAPDLNIGFLEHVDNAIKDYVISTHFYSTGDNYSKASELANSFLSNLENRRLTIAGSNEKEDPLGWTSLYMAAMVGDIETIHLCTTIDSGNQHRSRALMIAAQHGHTEIVDLLIQKGAFIDWDQHKWTPLMLATKNGYTAVVDLLIQNGADLDQKNHFWCTALRIAIQNNHHGIAVRLIESGAKIPPEIIDSELVTLFKQHEQRLLIPILNEFYLIHHAYHSNINKFKAAFQRNFDDLQKKHELSINEKECLILLYIVLRDDKERYERRFAATDFGTFFKSEYIHAKRDLTFLLKPQSTYCKKKEAAIDLLNAIKNKAGLPANPALYEGALGEITKKCFENAENGYRSEIYTHRTLSASGN